MVQNWIALSKLTRFTYWNWIIWKLLHTSLSQAVALKIDSLQQLKKNKKQIQNICPGQQKFKKYPNQCMVNGADLLDVPGGLNQPAPSKSPRIAVKNLKTIWFSDSL